MQGCLALIALALVAFGGWSLRPVFEQIGNYSLLIFFVAGVAILVALALPIAFAFGLATLGYLAFTTDDPLTVVIGRMDEGMSHLLLLGVPMFVLVGAFIQTTVMARAMIDFLAAILGQLRGGLSYVLLAAMYLVSGISGSKAADMAAVAPALFRDDEARLPIPGSWWPCSPRPEQCRRLEAAESLVLITVGSVTGISIWALFQGGLLPAPVLALMLCIVSFLRSTPSEKEAVAIRPKWGEIVRLFFIALPALALPFLIRGFVIWGIATATEVSTVAIVYVALAGLLIYRRCACRPHPRCLSARRPRIRTLKRRAAQSRMCRRESCPSADVLCARPMTLPSFRRRRFCSGSARVQTSRAATRGCATINGRRRDCMLRLRSS